MFGSMGVRACVLHGEEPNSNGDDRRESHRNMRGRCQRTAWGVYETIRWTCGEISRVRT